MPTYSYAHTPADPLDCPDFDTVQTIKEDALTKCPGCGKSVKRVITSAPSFTMQGGTPKFHG